MSIRESRPIWNRKHPLPREQAEKLARMIRRHGALGTSRLIGASVNVVEELASGGGCLGPVRDRVAERLRTMEQAS